jgi:hypothetical protein
MRACENATLAGARRLLGPRLRFGLVLVLVLLRGQCGLESINQHLWRIAKTLSGYCRELAFRGILMLFTSVARSDAACIQLGGARVRCVAFFIFFLIVFLF